MDERERASLEEMRGYLRQAVGWAREGGRLWTADEKTVAAVAHAVGQIGEMARRISVRTRAAHRAIPWTAMAGMRDRIYHQYGQLDRDVLAETVRRDLPKLDLQLDSILAAETSHGPRARRRR